MMISTFSLLTTSPFEARPLPHLRPSGEPCKLAEQRFLVFATCYGFPLVTKAPRDDEDKSSKISNLKSCDLIFTAVLTSFSHDFA